jgi:hypothetical protein
MAWPKEGNTVVRKVFVWVGDASNRRNMKMLREDLDWVSRTLKEFLPPNGRQGVGQETYCWVYFAECFSPGVDPARFVREIEGTTVTLEGMLDELPIEKPGACQG